MRPAFSIIFFTVLSGAGFGLLFLTGLSLVRAPALFSPFAVFMDDTGLRVLQMHARSGCELALACGALLATAGLLFSVGHLGKPLRAWRAFSQWRSSWLSREGVVSVLTFVPIAGLLLWMLADGDVRSRAVAIGGALLAFLSAATVFCTGRIYSSLKPIRAWHNGYVVPGYLLLAVYTGALWMLPLHRLDATVSPFTQLADSMHILNAFAIAPLCAGLKLAYWRSLDRRSGTPNAGDATGLARFGTVRSFEQPHTEENYLTHEMGFVLARKHSRRLRLIAFFLILLAPISTFPIGNLIGQASIWTALILGMLGVFVERWLFFAQARHAVIAFYGR
jgi:DMSO reductase anchor subunit